MLAVVCLECAEPMVLVLLKSGSKRVSKECWWSGTGKEWRGAESCQIQTLLARISSHYGGTKVAKTMLVLSNFQQYSVISNLAGLVLTQPPRLIVIVPLEAKRWNRSTVLMN